MAALLLARVCVWEVGDAAERGGGWQGGSRCRLRLLHDSSVPAWLPVCTVYQPFCACSTPCLATLPACLPAYLPAHLPASLCLCLPAFPRSYNIWHTWNEGLMGAFQTLREQGLLPLVQVDEAGNMR